jgi:protein-export membrane protein, SecD/SecF family
MLNQYPLWKYLLILVVILVAIVYTLPNLYGEDPAIQISPSRGAVMDEAIRTKVLDSLETAGMVPRSVEKEQTRLLVRFANTEAQLKAADLLSNTLGERYVVALNLAPATPEWLRAIQAAPMYLGLDLRGGVHFLMEVDMQAAVSQAEERYVEDLRSLLRSHKLHYSALGREEKGGLKVKFRTLPERDNAQAVVHEEYPGLQLSGSEDSEGYYLTAHLSDQEQAEIRKFALQQNITTVRNRVNELGVAEPVIQQQGQNYVVVQLPGVQDTARAKEILGATATLEFRMVDEEHDAREAAQSGRIPVGSRLYHERNGTPVLLKKQVMLTGEYITDAASGIEQQTGSPAVYITLDSKGGRIFSNATKDNVGKLLAVVFIENKTETRQVDGKPVKHKKTIQEVINVARIREQLGKRFQITGLDNTTEARNLALLLRAGALAAPIAIVEERTVGPSLGQENIDQGVKASIVSFLLVVVFMAVYYRLFGLLADLALTLNLVLMVAALSMLQATLTLPGIAGIALTIGMAVDANVLIYERIREELRNGNTPQASIHAGYERALATITDSNITTLIAALVLFIFGTGPIRGFAVTLSIGIVTSMFTAIMGTRSLVNLIYGGRRVAHLAI